MSEPPSASFNCDMQWAPGWQQRAAACAAMLEPVLRTADGSLRTVFDVGCGDQKLRRALEERDVRCEYRGFDLRPQTPDTTPIDLHTDTLPAGADVIVMLGVVEYLRDLGAVLANLPAATPRLLISHVVRERSSYTEAQLRELGWINHLTTTEITQMLLRSGFRVQTITGTDEGRVLLFSCLRDSGRSAR